ncbi:50S ribosomal protein L31 [Candidatus Shapirobacteria bacterium CG10_big_fil_rev_8_21_14_0_10_48_15]|uniref:Large ribosomal subunit protein bL31 n=1 Tax=Candidatus Shapirobacteria bacterium CG10_big_fil_rev_8_21_14_0_10_48_15 TaxID=1974484 RepID=A0A2M8L6L9_9BACT|nr:MAG: 50S ribosomal protein L31 [Candidatus Shapirobacteria bacterium CG10_big_fil_rev_8_21_14_0_10_48_15]
MKQAVHPKWYPEAKVTCACGNSFTTGSTLPAIQVDICSQCHPFFTGQTRFVDTQGRVEKFQAKQKAVAGKKYIKKKDKKILQEKREREEEKKRPKTLKEVLLAKS